MDGVFLCYRREDTGDVVGRLADRLEDSFGSGFVFRDVDDVPVAEDFRRVIDDALTDARCVLVAIGPSWVDARNSAGERRLDLEDDPVRVEIETALARKAKIIPLLVGRVTMPSKSLLPASISKLADINGVPIRQDPDFDRDVERLIESIETLKAGPTKTRRRRDNGRFRWWIAGSAAAGLGLIALVTFLLISAGQPTVPSVFGLSDVEAAQVLEPLGIEISTSSETNDAPAGQVIDQSPAPGSKSQSLTLILSSGPPPPEIPEVVTLTVDAAREQLEAAGIEVVESSQPSLAEPGIVIGQFPLPGEIAQSVVLFVSEGSPDQIPTVPAVVGLLESEVRLAAPAGLEIVATTLEDEADVGVVINQDPQPGARSTRLAIDVSAGPGLPVTPELIGVTLEDAQTLLDELSVTINSTSFESAIEPSGVVIDQSPSGGARSDTVSLVVSSGPGADQIAGDWRNIDEKTRGMTRLLINAGDDQSVTMQGFGSCSPIDCDWGVVNGTVTEGTADAKFVFSFKTTSVSARLVGEFLIVEIFDDYSEGADISSMEVLTRSPFNQLRVEAITTAVQFEPALAPILIAQYPELVEVIVIPNVPTLP